MLTKVEAELINSILRETCKLGLTPKDWDSKECRAIPTTKKWKKCVSSGFTFLWCGYWTFVLLRLPIIFAYYNLTAKLDDAIMYSILLIIRINGAAYVISNSLYMEDVLYLQQLTTNFNYTYGCPRFGRKYLNENLREKILKYLVVGCYGLVPIFGMMFLVNPENPAFIYSALPDSSRTKSALALFCLIELTNAFIIVQLIVTLLSSSNQM